MVVITESGPRSGLMRFAQFCWYDKGIHAEIPGTRGLTTADTDGARIISDAGWQQPEPYEDENWWTRVPWPAPSSDYQRLASMIVTALHDAFDIPSPDSLEYDAWNENSGNSPLALPLLGIPFNPVKQTLQITREAEA